MPAISAINIVPHDSLSQVQTAQPKFIPGGLDDNYAWKVNSCERLSYQCATERQARQVSVVMLTR